jgi:hypothetical protein
MTDTWCKTIFGSKRRGRVPVDEHGKNDGEKKILYSISFEQISSPGGGDECNIIWRGKVHKRKREGDLGERVCVRGKERGCLPSERVETQKRKGGLIVSSWKNDQQFGVQE